MSPPKCLILATVNIKTSLLLLVEVEGLCSEIIGNVRGYSGTTTNIELVYLHKHTHTLVVRTMLHTNTEFDPYNIGNGSTQTTLKRNKANRVHSLKVH